MAVKFTKIQETSATAAAPVVSATTQYSTGIDAPAGPVEFLMVRTDGTWGADPCLADYGNLVSTFRVVLNGEPIYDFRAGYAAHDNNACSLWNYFLNSIGGRAYEVPTGSTTREVYWAIPIGRQCDRSVNRWEIIISYAEAETGASITSFNLSFWLKMNDAMMTTTTVVPSTSFSHTSGSIEQVIVNVPQNVQGVVSAIFIQNSSAADQIGAQGVRVNALGDYGLEFEMLRFLNGDMANGIMYADNEVTSTGGQLYATSVKGGMLLPVYGLVGGNIALQVNSSATTTRTYTPVITKPVGAKDSDPLRQTQASPASTAKSILKGNLD